MFKGIIITGTSCSGKSSLAEKMQDEHAMFEIVEAVTTRNPRNDDFNYAYLSQDNFEQLSKQKKLLVETTYRDKSYGIVNEKYESILINGKVPILILTPASTAALLETREEDFMCFFIDAPDCVLEKRMTKREHREYSEEEKEQLVKDREYSYKANYVLQNIVMESSIALIEWLWEHQNQGGGLSQRIIQLMLDCGMLLEHSVITGIKGASYDLLLGDEYYYAGKVKKLSDDNPFLTIEPYDYAIVSCKEIACMPRDVIAKFGLTVGLFCQGIILSNGPQIDPGFHGTLFCLLFNTSNRAVHLKRGQHYATIEFNKLIEAARPYSGKYQDKKNIIDYIPANALYGAINELKKEIEKLKNESHTMQNIYLGVVGLMFAIISILLVLQ